MTTQTSQAAMRRSKDAHLTLVGCVLFCACVFASIFGAVIPSSGGYLCKTKYARITSSVLNKVPSR